MSFGEVEPHLVNTALVTDQFDVGINSSGFVVNRRGHILAGIIFYIQDQLTF